jgi:hypothetical protein
MSSKKLLLLTDDMMKAAFVDYFKEHVIFEDIQDYVVPFLQEKYNIDLTSLRETEALQKHMVKWITKEFNPNPK